MPRRASRNITLVLIGAAALQGCSPSADRQTVARDDYQSLEDCTADWGRPEHCERQQLSSNAGNSTYYRGPIYVPGHRWGAQRQARDETVRAGATTQLTDGPSDRSIRSTTTQRSTASSPTSRGGFGSSARSFGSSSS